MVVKEIEYNNDINIHGVAKISKDEYILINFHDDNSKVGYLEAYFNNTKKINLETIYCLDKYRSQGIGSTLIDILDYLLYDYDGYTLKGVYYPTQMLEDIGVLRPNDELDVKARSFYFHKGFDIVSYKEYISNPSKYPLININDFSTSILKFGRSVVYKEIKRKENYRFTEINSIICEDPAYKIKRLV